MTTRIRSTEGTVRVFVAVGISAEAREQLIDAVERIRRDIPQGIQWANPDGMHLTLKFLGNIPSVGVGPLLECLEPVASEAKPFPLRLDGLGMFPNRRKPRVLWAGVGGDLDALARLQQTAESAITALGYPPPGVAQRSRRYSMERPFRPHVTLGRPRRNIPDAQLARIGSVVSAIAPPSPVGWQVESVDVMRSELHPSGARYTVLGSAPLKSPLPIAKSPPPAGEG